jgi:allantoicase
LLRQPFFDPTAFCAEGKVMDSWESVRHNPLPYDECIIRLPRTSIPRFAEVSTMWHEGNQCPQLELYGKRDLSESETWIPLLARVSLQGHAVHRFVLLTTTEAVRFVRVLMVPDGGLSRLRLYEEKPQGVVFPSQQRCEPTVIPAVVKAKQLFDGNASNATRDTLLQSLRTASANARCLGALVNVVHGAKVRNVSNQHYGPADAIVSVCPPRGMFDGFETSRARASELRNKFESVEVELLLPMRLTRVDVDFTYFVNNNPNELSVELETDQG